MWSFFFLLFVVEMEELRLIIIMYFVSQKEWSLVHLISWINDQSLKDNQRLLI